jgi:hypothetical protein
MGFSVQTGLVWTGSGLLVTSAKTPQGKLLQMGLKETLADLVAAGEQERQRKEDAPHKLKAWLKEIDDLYTRVKEYLSEHASLRFGSKPVQLSEDKLGGKYQADILLIYAGSDDRPVVVALEPTASMSPGASGVVEMYRADRSGRRVRLYRAEDREKSFDWYVGEREKRVLLSKASLEAHLDLLFRA